MPIGLRIKGMYFSASTCHLYCCYTMYVKYFELLFCSRPRALAARVYYVKLLPTLNKDYLSIYLICFILNNDEENMDWSPQTNYHETYCKALALDI